MEPITLIGLIASLMTIVGVPGLLQLRKLSARGDEAKKQLAGLELDFRVLFWKLIKLLIWFAIFYAIYVTFSYSLELIENGHSSYLQDAGLQGFLPGLLSIGLFTAYILYSAKKLVLWEIILYLLMASVITYFSWYLILFDCCDQTDGVIPFVLSMIFALLLSNLLYRRRVAAIEGS